MRSSRASGRVCRAETIVDESSPLETISTEFMMCDGPAWDGASSLYVPDVKGGKLYRYRPGPKKLDVVLADAGRISAAFYNHGRLFLSDNGESCICLAEGWKESLDRRPRQGRQAAYPAQRPGRRQSGRHLLHADRPRQGHVHHRRWQADHRRRGHRHAQRPDPVTRRADAVRRLVCAEEDLGLRGARAGLGVGRPRVRRDGRRSR